MSFHFFAYINRMKYINRWGLMRNTRPENDTEHEIWEDGDRAKKLFDQLKKWKFV